MVSYHVTLEGVVFYHVALGRVFIDHQIMSSPTKLSNICHWATRYLPNMTYVEPAHKQEQRCVVRF